MERVPQDLHIHTTYSSTDNMVVARQAAAAMGIRETLVFAPDKG